MHVALIDHLPKGTIKLIHVISTHTKKRHLGRPHILKDTIKQTHVANTSRDGYLVMFTGQGMHKWVSEITDYKTALTTYNKVIYEEFI